MKIFKAWHVAGPHLVGGRPWGTDESVFRPGDLVGLLTSLPAAQGASAPAWKLEIRLGRGEKTLYLPVEPFLTVAEYRQSKATPLPFYAIASVREVRPDLGAYVWLFDDIIYLTERNPQSAAEEEEVVQRMKQEQIRRHAAQARLR
ncbi:MAG: hypothetical protein P3B98_02670, partial [Gemmatimonadota bacterium]|nr:hypothetical protein [Gemmatimonadota bacterium]